MRILFVGQLGLPLLSQREQATAETRVASLATALAAKNHRVLVLGTTPYVTGTGMNYHGVEAKRIASLNPEQPGGWFYLLRSVVTAFVFKPSVVHLQGVRAASLARLMRLGNRHATLVWTQDSAIQIPGFLARWIARGLDEITVPTRQVQYQLLTTYGIRATYIPDGYTASTLPTVSSRHFGVRVVKYNVLLADSAVAVSRVAKAYKQAGVRSKLVVLQDATGAYKRLAKQYRFLQFVGPVTGRGRHSLIADAGLTIADEAVATQVLLTSMDAGAAIVAANQPLHQELLGTSAVFYSHGQADGLVTALREVTTEAGVAGRLARQARKRARTHFTLTRTLSEYLASYQAYRQVVSLDSAKQTSFIQPRPAAVR